MSEHTPARWTDLAQTLYDRTHALHARSDGGRPHYYTALYAELTRWRQTEHRKSALRAVASPSLRRIFDEASHKSEWVDAIAHAFYDGVVKATMNLGMAQQLNIPDIAANALIEMERVMLDVTHNYRILLRPGRAPAVESVLRAYEDDLIPRARQALTALAREEGWGAERLAQITADVTARAYAGLDHLARLKL
jgi:hypothetical protein